jgi:Protein of unknown function (DUF2442)
MMVGVKIAKLYSAKLDGFIVKVKFSDGLVASVSLRHIFSKPKNLSAEILRGGMFEKCFIESGALGWPNGFELCPNAIYRWYRQSIDKKSA